MLTEEDRALLTGKNFASFSTLMPDGSPQTTVVWVDTDGEHVLVNTAVGRVKERTGETEEDTRRVLDED